MSELLTFIDARFSTMLRDLEQLVNLDSPSDEKSLTDKAMLFFSSRVQELTQAKIAVVKQEQYGNHVKLSIGAGDKQILILGHIDTVFPVGEAQRRSFHVKDGKLFGPGVFDMKCGLIQGLYAIYSVITHHALSKKIVFFINTDEEMGSPTSQAYIEEEALKSDAVFVLEPALGKKGALKTARKGVRRFKVEVEGVAAHAGIDPSKGCSALEELAYQIIYLHGLTDYNTGSTVNVGIANGGHSVNVVCDQAEAEVDLRTVTQREMDRLIALILNLKPRLNHTRITVKEGIKRPPMEKQVSRQLFHQAQQIGSNIGLKIEEASTGGASDGNFTAALGIPTLDGMGAVGNFAHSENEYVDMSYITRKSALLAHLIKAQCVLNE
ncbi:peptidase M20 [Pullulanibacillus camelliae]|uniref:Peptidase M20 n=1 Tax=Pullulanibacillus camelliae TaxID=1707096 RepID=A0A8J2VJ45_9BACL|nr:M20 family metallopeptidase [Pullulanibacillus camelliae]GGE26972.1 peptidase M20 [Pullulanibacillus camelliae]